MKWWPRVDPLALAVTLALGAAGGLFARLAHLPVAMLLGALLVTGGIALSGWRPLGRSVTLPVKLRTAFIPVIGVSIGGSFAPDVLAEAVRWWPSLLSLLLYLPLAHGIGILIYTKGGLPRLEAFFGAVPGGLIEAVQMGEEAGADPALTTILQFLRLILTILAVPLIFSLLTGGAVGSSARAAMPGGAEPLTLSDGLVLAVVGVLGFGVGRWLRLPAAPMTGPLLLSAAAHGFGLVEGAPPGWLIAATQVVVGCGLGVRFGNADHRPLKRAAPLAAVNTLIALAVAFLFAIALSLVLAEPATAVFLAFAPGGVAEMSLIALGLELSVAYVTLHHILRIVLSLLIAQSGARVLRGRAGY
jgi:membrane AbrB-like protein